MTLLSSTVDRLAQCLIRLLAMEAMEAIASNFTQDVLHAVLLSSQVRQQEINTSEHRCPLGTVLSEILDKVVFDVREPNFGKWVQLKLPSSSTYHEIVDGIIKVTGLPEGVFVMSEWSCH